MYIYIYIYRYISKHRWKLKVMGLFLFVFRQWLSIEWGTSMIYFETAPWTVTILGYTFTDMINLGFGRRLLRNKIWWWIMAFCTQIALWQPLLSSHKPKWFKWANYVPLVIISGCTLHSNTPAHVPINAVQIRYVSCSHSPSLF